MKFPFLKNDPNKKKNKPLIPWISDHHRLIVVNDQTFIEEKNWRLSPKNVLKFSIAVFLLSAMLTLLLAKYTPLGSLIAPPARFVNSSLRNEMESFYKELDSLNREIKSSGNYIESLKKISSENFEYEKDAVKDTAKLNTETGVKTFADVPSKSEETQKLIDNERKEKEINKLVQSIFSDESIRFDKGSFVPPLRGIVSDTFAPGRNHFGTDVVAAKGSVIVATRNGTVIMSSWSADTGHMIGIQHNNNLVSWYKHNSARLKNLGDRVSAGEAVAVIGNSGEMSSGPHLHFELWYNGHPVNPQNYIEF
jgi:murein DD-endopeptidase MepM/ murein hydrolase activator NlpD